MSSPTRSSAKPKINTKPDFENNLADFEAAFLFYVVEVDPNFDVSLLSGNPAPAQLEGTVIPPAEVMHPISKQELTRLIQLKGPRTVNTDVFGDQIVLENDVRVKGNVYGVRSVRVGANCVIEGDVVSDGPITIEKNCRIEGSLVGADVELEGMLTVDGPIYSRSAFLCKGRLTAQSLTAEGNIVLIGDEQKDEVTLEASLIMSRQGELQIGIPVKLAGKRIDVDEQKFYVSPGAEALQLSSVPFEIETEVSQGTLLTTLTDAELEKLVAELAVLEQ